MSHLKFLVLAVLAIALLGGSSPVPAAQVAVDIGVAPVCPYGYFDYPPYDCAPYGYYGPDWFGVDGFFIGPYDLSVSVGIPGADFDHPIMSAALERVTGACRQHSKFVVTTIGDRQERDYSRRLVQRGVQGLVFATDALVLLQACKRMVSFTR